MSASCDRCGKPLVHGVLIVSEDGSSGAMVGRECLNQVGSKRPPMAVQTLIFPKDRFGRGDATRWATAHGFSASKVDETDRSYRLRQIAPKKFDHGTFRTISFGKSGVSAVVARKNHVGDGRARAERIAALFSAKGYPSKVHPINSTTSMIHTTVPGALWPVLTTVTRKKVEIDGAPEYASKLHALVREHFRGELSAPRANHTGWFLVDKVTKTVRKSSEHERDAPPRYVKVFAESPSDAVRRAQNQAGRKGPLFLVTTIEEDGDTLRYQGRSDHAADEAAIEWSARGYATQIEKLDGKREEVVRKYAAYEGRDPAVVAAHRARFGGG